jgi:nucleotide-binding universal stress UspA family protein
MATLPVVLVAVDGSDQCLQTITYLSRILSPNEIGIKLFHVSAEAPEAVFDLIGSGSSADEAEISNWRDLKGTQIQAFVDKARNVFTNAGFPPGAVNTTIRSRKIGIARDIINESKRGCSVVVIGRKGFGSLPDFMMGSIAAKLAESITHVPLAIVGGRPEPGRVLVAFDRSRSIRKGFENVSSLFSRALEQILLCHTIRPLSVPHPATSTFFSTRSEAHWLDEHSKRIIPEMVAMRKLISRAGFDPKIFGTVILEKKASRADAIAREADVGGFGTIVVGRHGASAVKEFSMGRVTRKLLALSFNKAIWIAC